MHEGTNKGQSQVSRAFKIVQSLYHGHFKFYIIKNVINGEARRMLEVYILNKTSSDSPGMTKRSQFLTLQTPYRSEQ